MNFLKLADDKKRILFWVIWAIVFLMALYLRMSGLFRGLENQVFNYHPDEPKQILALFNFLNGDYIRYYGEIFYDGYPYGLNHLDEYILRPMLAFLSNDEQTMNSSLYQLARLLRVTYGMALVGIIYLLVAGFVNNRKTALAAMFLYAIAPLPIAVSHFATGDIGVDLFTALCLLFLFYAYTGKRKKTWIFACGFAVGAAFSAKYNGIIAGMVPGLAFCLELLHKRDVPLFIKKTSILLAGTFLGILVFTPSLLLDFKTYLTHMWESFKFHQGCKVPPEILSRPWLERVLLGYENNTLYIITSLGFFVFCAYIAGLIFTIPRAFASFKNNNRQNTAPLSYFTIALSLFPLLTLIAVLTGKYALQPFHLSFLTLPLLVAMFYLYSTLSFSNVIIRLVGGIVLCLIVVEYGRTSWNENFFWRMEDNVYYEHNIPATVYKKGPYPSTSKGPMRSIFLEKHSVSVFKNASIVAIGPDAKFWNKIGVAPLPQIPAPIGRNWIFINGPTFPQNDKVIFVNGGSFGKTIKKHLVIPAENPWPTIGFRNGSYATTVTVNLGGAKTDIALKAHEQKIMYIEPKSWRYSESHNKKERVNIVPIDVSVPHDDVWLTFLSTQKEMNNFMLFGGKLDSPPPHALGAQNDVGPAYRHALQNIRYAQHTLQQPVWPNTRVPLWELPLPAGRYILTCTIEGLEDNATLSIEFEDAKGGHILESRKTYQIKKGLQTVEFKLHKPFAPYQGRFVASGVTGNVRIVSLRLKPDIEKLHQDFVRWKSEGISPVWNK